MTLLELQNRINEDAFISENVVMAEILEINPAKADERVDFLINQANGKHNISI